MGRLFIVRHGQTAHNRNGVVQGVRLDSDLDDEGARQAQQLAISLADCALDAVIASPLRRARQTAEAIVQMPEHQGRLTVTIRPEFYEVDYGDFAGRPLAEVSGGMEQVFDAWCMGYPSTCYPGGESAIVAQQRVRPFATALVEAAQIGNVVAVGHGQINRVLLATLTGGGLAVLRDFPQSNAGITELQVDADLRVTRINDTSHLHR